MGRQPALAAAANPTGDLHYTLVEVAMIEGWFGQQTVLSDSKATAKTVLGALHGGDYWHFSTHGRFERADAPRSGLEMAGGERLTIQTLLDPAAKLSPPRLVVLSACETALYDVDDTPWEFIGLPSAFLQLGAGGVVGTLWPVDELSTALLMARFYDLHLGEGQEPARALRSAQLWLRDATNQDLQNYVGATAGRLSLEQVSAVKVFFVRGEKTARPFSHPVYWGGFTFTGE